MTKLDLVLARIRELPPEEQEQIAQEIELILDHGPEDYRLAPEQEAELARRLADPNRKYVSHEQVAEYFEKKYGR
jgi:putative addiction module component (TIGR02574 family)